MESELKRVGPATFTYDPGGELVFAPGPDGKVEHLFLGMYAAKKIGTAQPSQYRER